MANVFNMLRLSFWHSACPHVARCITGGDTVEALISEPAEATVGSISLQRVRATIAICQMRQ